MASILVVDDEPDVRELFNITLKMAGHMTNTVQDGQEALEALSVELPDLILLDLMMPRVNGFEFLEAVRTERKDEPLRVLVATAKVIEDAEQEKLSKWPVVGVLNKGELDIGRMVMIVAEALSEDPKNPNGTDKSKPESETKSEAESESESKPKSE